MAPTIATLGARPVGVTGHGGVRPAGGRRVGPYELRDEIGRGAASRVFAARHLRSAESVAFKEFRSRPGSPPERRRFRTEARILGSIDHPHVVTARDVIEDDNIWALVMELISRGSLRQHIRSGLGLAQTGRVLEDLLSGLGQLESQHVVHLDIKPDNLLVTSSGRIKITDFGVAQEVGPGRERQAELIGGTPQYLAPEQAAGAPLGAWTDLYAVGILAFELLVGRPPFADTHDLVDIMDRHLHDRIPRVCDVLPGMSTAMADWIDRLVSKTPSDRPQSAEDAWDELDKLLTECLGSSWRLAAGL
jgi:serine/threonine protein kinase